jgi:uncharacterized protein (DUF4415 family)
MTNKIPGTPEAWENGPLGKDAAFAEKHLESDVERSAIDEAFGLKAISIRLEAELIESYKAVAKHYGMGYQPLMRQALHRFVDSELKKIAIDAMQKDEPSGEIELPNIAKAA